MDLLDIFRGECCSCLDHRQVNTPMINIQTAEEKLSAGFGLQENISDG